MQDAGPSLTGTAKSSTGVYVGTVWEEYQIVLDKMNMPASVNVLTGSGMSFMIGRISYTFGYQGLSSAPPLCHTSVYWVEVTSQMHLDLPIPWKVVSVCREPSVITRSLSVLLRQIEGLSSRTCVCRQHYTSQWQLLILQLHRRFKVYSLTIWYLYRLARLRIAFAEATS